MNRRYFLNRLASGLVAAVAPAVFVPKLIKPSWSGLALTTPIKPVFDKAVGRDYSVVCFVDFVPSTLPGGTHRIEMREAEECAACGLSFDKCQCQTLHHRTYKLSGNKIVVTEADKQRTIEMPKGTANFITIDERIWMPAQPVA